MSQYPSPYLPPATPAPYGGQDFLAPARRAGTLLYVVGGLILLLSTCNTISFILTPTEQMMEQMKQQMAATGQPVPFSSQTYRIVVSVCLALMIGYGIALVLLGTGVRRGGKASIIGALVVTGIALVLLAIMLLFVLIAATQNPLVLVFGCVGTIPSALHGVLAYWLISALRSISKFGSNQQYAAQYWQYQQNVQAYAYAQAQQQQGYPQQPPGMQGYATAPPPPPPPGLTEDSNKTDGNP